jgi:hypothetical protein
LNASASGLSPPANARFALITVSAGMTWRDDGTAPTSTLGLALPTGIAPWLYAGDLTAIQFFGTGNVNLSYYK